MLLREGEVTVGDAAAILGRHRITVWKWCRDRLLASRRRGRYFYPRLKAVLALRKHERRIETLKAETKHATSTR